VCHAGEFNPFKPSGDPSAQSARREPFESPDVEQKVFDAHPSVDTSLLREVADAILHVERITSKHAQFTRVRANERHDHANQGTFPRAIRTEKSDERTALRNEIEWAHGFQASKPL
jgi:hypothetical protein